MVHRPGLGGQVLNGVHALHRATAIIIDSEVALDPGKRRKRRVGWVLSHQDEVVLLLQCADDKGTQLTACPRDEHLHRVLSSRGLQAPRSFHRVLVKPPDTGR